MFVVWLIACALFVARCVLVVLVAWSSLYNPRCCVCCLLCALARCLLCAVCR